MDVTPTRRVRRAFLSDACAGGEALRQEVASLLAHEQTAERVLSSRGN